MPLREIHTMAGDTPSAHKARCWPPPKPSAKFKRGFLSGVLCAQQCASKDGHERDSEFMGQGPMGIVEIAQVTASYKRRGRPVK